MLEVFLNNEFLLFVGCLLMKKILWIPAVITVGLYICGPVQDPDLWWHITVGRWILAHGGVPHHDHWNMFSVGQPWRAYSWSNEIVYALVDRYFGLKGLLSLKLVLAAFLALGLSYFLSRIAGDWFFGALLGILSTTACFNHFTLRPQVLVWIYFAAVIYVAERVSQEGLTSSLKVALIFIMALWANTHITTVIALATVVLWLINRREPELAVLAGLYAFAGTLITPYLGGEWFTFFESSSHPLIYNSIAEFGTANIMQYSTAFLVFAAVILLTFLHYRPKAIEMTKLFLWSVIQLGALAVIKFLPFAVILSSALTALIWRRESADRRVLGNLPEAIDRFRKLVFGLSTEGLSFVFVCMSIVNVYKVWKDPLAFETVPKRPFDFFMEKKLPFPLLNEFGRGGYVMY
ncbi:MAG: hypothetical protein D6719_10175, partial [Candidatus Dadabacteria bacterium]